MSSVVGSEDSEQIDEQVEAVEAIEPAPLREVIKRGVIGSLLAAVCISLLLQASTYALFYPTWMLDQFITGGAFYVDTLFIWVLIGFLWAVLGRLWLTIGILGAVALMFGLGTAAKIHFREEPVYPSDIEFLDEPGFLSSLVPLPYLVLAVIAVVAVVALAVRHGRRMDVRYPRPRWNQLPREQAMTVVGLRVAVGLITALLIAQAGQFNQPGNLWRGLYELRGDQWRYWNQKTNYRSNGFVGGFLYNMPIEAMAQPKGYDAPTMSDLADRYEKVAGRINAGRTGTLDDVNVVFVLSESFSDPTQLEGFDLDRDPIPRTRALMKQTMAGQMMAQLYGGGTANMEFEALTGQSLGLFRAQMLSPYQMLVPDQPNYPSAVGWFKSQGHDAIAIHPYRVGMYKREQVYKSFGFESFIHDTTMSKTDKIDDNPYISDASAFAEVRKQIADHDRPLFVNLVTMQNHIPVKGNYDDPIKVSDAGGNGDEIGQYARGLEHTDEALADFLADLQADDEKTIVVFYGDHLPGIYGSDVKNDNKGLPLYRTPFLIWSSDQAQNKAIETPLTSAAFFLPLLYEVADAPVPPYLALLDRLHKRVSALQQGRMYNVDGEKITESDLDAESAQLLEDLRKVQFDFSIGKRLVLDRMWPGAVS